MEHYLVYDKTLNDRVRQNGSALPCHPAYSGSCRVILSSNSASNSSSGPPNTDKTGRIEALDPNNDSDERAVRHWLSLSDYYTFPHVVLFSSAEHLVDILESLTHDGNDSVGVDGDSRRWKRLRAISEAMRQVNRTQLKRLLRYWRTRLLDIAQRSPNAPFS